MKVRFLRNLGTPALKELDLDVEDPQALEGTEADVTTEQAKKLFAANLAEPADKRAEAAFSKGDAPAPEPAAISYESMNLDQLHQEATRRNLEGRAGLDKAGLVKALERDDRKAGKK
jgi:hypothetical protein